MLFIILLQKKFYEEGIKEPEEKKRQREKKEQDYYNASNLKFRQMSDQCGLKRNCFKCNERVNVNDIFCHACKLSDPYARYRLTIPDVKPKTKKDVGKQLTLTDARIMNSKRRRRYGSEQEERELMKNVKV